VPEVTVSWADRLALCGKTGSGKTFLARALTAPVRRLLVLDPKGTLNRPDWRLQDWTPKAAREMERGKAGRLRVPYPFERDGDWSYWLQWAYSIGNVLVYIDEMYGVVEPYKRPSAALMALYTRGRELGIGTWAATQRPSAVPIVMFSEAEWLYQFRLLNPDDLKRVASWMGSELSLRIPFSDPFGFWTYNPAWPAPIYTKQLIA
jgi:hypothetical protein